jgi:hypothetical protein
MAFDPTDPNRIFAGSHSSGVYIIERTQHAADTAKKDEVGANGN